MKDLEPIIIRIITVLACLSPDTRILTTKMFLNSKMSRECVKVVYPLSGGITLVDETKAIFSGTISISSSKIIYLAPVSNTE